MVASDLDRDTAVDDSFSDFEEGPPLDFAGWSPRMLDQLQHMISTSQFMPFADALARVGNCAHPIRLLGSSMRIDAATGENLSSYASRDEPLGVGVTYIRCGNQRASVCPACSRVYAADVFHLIRAGVMGGKTVPASVAENPLVFATLTAPSFGHVHSTQACGRPHSSTPRCPHGRPSSCLVKHGDDDTDLGQPLCPDCYDYASQAVWQWWAPDLWRRFTIALRRLIAKTLGVPGRRIGDLATVQYAKVAEYQRRGVVHFHALIRLDGPRTPEGFAASPAQITSRLLAQLVQAAVETARLSVPGVDHDDPPRHLAFGRQLDVRPVRLGRRSDDPNAPLVPEQVAGHLAKYATKSASDSGSGGTAHAQRINATIRELAQRAHIATLHGHGGADDYLLLGKWVDMLGFRGHFASKSRRYAISLTALRRARRRASMLIAEARESRRPLDLAALEADLLADADDDTTLVIGRWSYAGVGWDNDAEQALALSAAASRPRIRPTSSRREEGNPTGRKVGFMVVPRIEDRLWSVRDVSEYLGISVQTLYAWRSAATGPPGRRVGRRLRYRPQDVRDWVAALPTEIAG
jgi:predicted DNA-binding transcriptional regulator AlpA